jgi:hypothetical protein
VNIGSGEEDEEGEHEDDEEEYAHEDDEEEPDDEEEEIALNLVPNPDGSENSTPLFDDEQKLRLLRKRRE